MHAVLQPTPRLFPRLFVLLLLTQPSASCPSACSCKWKAGKEWVECASRGLQGLPQGAREETQVLDLSGNQLLSLAADCFFVLRLVNLQRLYLGRSRIRRIAALAFTGLQGLVELDISENELEQVPSETFASVGNLMRLNLAGNPLHELQRDGFRHLGQLTFLDLSRCRLSRLEAGAFAGLHALEWLRLNDNLLTGVPEATLPLSAGLHGLPLHGNPWLCDCQLAALRDWLRASQVQAAQEAEPSCAEPGRLRARSVRTLKPQDLACAPRLTLPERLDVYEGDNATLQCEVQAIPQPVTLWLLNGEPLDLGRDQAKDQRIRYSYSEDSSENKITANLEIVDADNTDEGNYICQAENAAGTVWGNITLYILRREHSTVEPPSESPGAGYAAAIAAGALLGTLLALGCLFLSIFLYARRLRSHSKSNLKQPTTGSSIVLPSILKKSTSDSCNKAKSEVSITYSQVSDSCSNSGIVPPGSACRDSATELAKLRELTEAAYLQNKQMPQRFIEPDLINEVPPENGYLEDHYRRPCLEPYSNCLDRDGYPLNFGLPKLAPAMLHLRSGAACETLPRIRQRQQLLLTGSAAVPTIRLSREAEFLARGSHAFPTHPVLEIGYAALVPTPFIPSPPAAYRSEPAALSPRSLIHAKTQLESVGAVGGLVHISSSNMLHQLPAEPSENREAIEHPESPDEGYVGDAMDV